MNERTLGFYQPHCFISQQGGRWSFICNQAWESCAGLGICSFVKQRQEEEEGGKGRRGQVYQPSTVLLLACLHLTSKFLLLHSYQKLLFVCTVLVDWKHFKQLSSLLWREDYMFGVFSTSDSFVRVLATIILLLLCNKGEKKNTRYLMKNCTLFCRTAFFWGLLFQLKSCSNCWLQVLMPNLSEIKNLAFHFTFCKLNVSQTQVKALWGVSNLIIQKIKAVIISTERYILLSIIKLLWMMNVYLKQIQGKSKTETKVIIRC